MIRSSMQSAQEVATNMSRTADAIQRVAEKHITIAQKTNLTVNERAQEANGEATMIAELFFTSFQETINNIRSVAKEFERTDVELDSSIHQLLQHSDGLDKWSSYERAKNR